MKLELLLGLLCAAGAWLVITSITSHRQQDFSDRIAPQLRGSELRKSRFNHQYENLPEGLYGGATALVTPMIQWALKIVNRANFDTVALEKRLQNLGTGLTVSEYRIQQIIWALLALLVSSIVVSLGAVSGRVSIAPGLMLILLATVAGFIGRDYWLGQQIKKREQAMLEEFPALAELMALSVAAGETGLGSLERVVRCSNGELAKEFTKILAMTRSGETLVASLQTFSQRTTVAALSRFVDGLIVAIERGTPLADVLRAQAQDVRDNAKRDLMETAGKKEIGMMAPVVFMILPLTVVFALFPGVSLLNLNF
ncbi:type II secretion system F family protein [Rothia nasimurium]|uniref:type II secretion system F family protein n=2 Tax=Rothia nasimurium TaxID=85336 RepID=UPI001F2D3C51|nr:type II secretion system F family protein [Rothia nasimurium]